MPDSINVAEVQWDKPDDKIDTGAIKWDKPEEKPTYQPSESINDESLIKSTDQSQGKPSSFFDSLQKARQLDNVDGNKAFIALKNAELLGVDPSYAYINHDVVNEQVTNKLTDEKESDPNLAKIKAPGYFDIATDMVKKAASYLISGDTDLFTPRPNARHDLMNHYEDDGSSLSSYTKAQNEKEEEWFRESRAEQANMRIKAIISQPESSSIFVEYFKKPIIQDYNMLGQVVNSAALPVALIIQEMTGSDEPIKILEDGIEKFRIQQKIAEFDPKTSFAGSVVKNLIKIAPFMLIPGAKEIFTAGATLESGYSAAESGVDATTATELGIASGVGTYGMLSIPLWAKNIWARVAAATTVFPLAGMAERKAEKGILSANDYKELSEQVKVFDKRTLASDLAMNIIFGLMAKEPPRSPRDTINALKVLQKLSDKNLKVEDRHASFNAASNVFNGEVPDAAQFGYHTDQLLNLNKDYQDRIHVRTALQDIYARFGIKPDEASANIKKLAGDNPTPESLSDAIDTYKTSLQEKTALRPAITVGGQELIGNVGDSHTDILRSNNLYEGEDDERYFVDPQGNKLTRLQARDYVKENDPSAYREWVAINGNGEKGEFHSRDYAEAADIDHKDPNKLSDKPVWSMTPEEVSDHQDNINREYGRLAGNAKDDEANLGPDHEQSQRSAKALEDFERQHPEWIGGNPEDAKATHEAYIKWAIDNDKDVTPEMVAPYPDRVKQFEQTAKGRLAMAEYNVRKLAKDNGIKINKIEKVDEEMPADWSNPDHRAGLKQHGITEEEYNDAIAEGKPWTVYGEHTPDIQEGGQINGSNIRLFRGYTAEDLWYEFVHAAQAQGIDLSKYGDTLESQAANLEKRLADGNSIPELGVIKTESATDSILKIVEANPKGFTIDISNGKQFSGKGYIVSPSKRTATVVNKITAGNINSFLEKFKAVFDSDKRTFLGGWFCDDKASPDFGKYVFDVSFVVDNYADSVYIADIGKQDGIFYQKGLDHAENRYIPTSEGIEDLKKSGVYDESRRSELGGLQESLHRLIPDEGDVDRGTDTGTASVPESAEGLVRPAESNASEQRPESVPDYSIRRKINLPEDGRKRVKEELAKNPSAGAIKQFKDKPAILTHWSNQDNLTQTDPTKHGTGFAGAEMKSKQAYPELFLPRTYASYGKYQKEWGLGGNRYKIRVPGNRLYDAWEDPLKIYPSMEEVEKMGYHDAAAQRLIYENRIKDAGFAGFVSSKFGAAAIFEPMKVEAVKPGQKSLRQEPVRMNEPQYSIKQKMDDETHRKAVETGDEKTAQKMVDEKAKEVGWDKDVLPSTFDDFGNIVPLSKMFDPLPDTRYSIRQKDKTATDETQPKPATPKPEFKPKEDKPERFSILKEKTPVPAKDSEGNLVGVKKAVQVEEREQRGMPQFESPGTKSDKEHQQAAADLLEVIPGYGQRFVANLLENPRALTKEEVPILSLYKADLLSQEKTILAAKQDARERGATKQEMSKLEDEHNSLKSNIEKTILAGDMSGYEASIGFNARKQMVRDDYSAVRMEMRSKDAGKGKDLTPEEKKKIEETVLKLYKASDATSEHLKEKAAKYDADQAIDKIKREIAAAERKAKRTATKEDIYAQRNAILASIRERTKSSAATPHVGIDPEIASDLVKLAKTYVMEGITDVAQLVDNIHENVKDMIEGVTQRDIRDAITGYGKEKKEVTKDALTLAINEAKKQMKLISAIEDAEKGIAPAKPGERKEASPEVQKLRADLEASLKKSGLIDEKEELEQDLGARTERLKKQIADLVEQYETGEGKPAKEKVPYTEEEQTLADLKKKIKAAVEFAEGPKPTKEKPVPTLEEQLRKGEESLAKAITDWEQKIKDLEEGKVKEGKKALPEEVKTTRMKELERELNLLKEIHKALKDEAKPPKVPKTPEEINAKRLESWKKRVTARIEDMEARMESGDYEKPKKERVPIALDKEGMDLKEREDRIKNELEDLVEKKRQANMSAPEKLKDMILKVRRFSLLSRVVIFGKLGIAAISRFGLTPLETGVGTIIQLAPWVKTIAEQAHREGATFKGSQEAAALRQVWEKGTWEDVPKLWKTGLGQLDVLHGNKAYSGTPELLNSMGRLHSICKIIPKRAEYYRSFEIIADWYHKNGYDLKDPSVIARIGAESYIEANRAIFMNDNFEVRWFRTFIGKMENVKPSEGGSEVAPIGGKLLSLGLETEFPIIKVASNFANETASYNAGGVGAIARLVARSKTFGGKGYKNLSNEDANFIMRNLKKNSVGLLLASAVFSGLVKVTFGGLYQKEEKRDPNALGPGEIAINGKKLPKLGSYFLTHIPIVLALQVFQTMVNAYDAERLKGEGLISRTVGAAGAGASALASNVPFVGNTDRDLPSLFTSKGREKYIESLVVSFLPTFDADKVAKVMDKDRPTKPENIGQQFENIIPGMRENVPTNERTVKREIIAAKRAGQPLNEYQQDYYNKLDYDDKHKLTKEAKMTFNQATFKNETLSNQIKTWDQLKDEEKLQVGQLLINKYNSLVDRDIHKSRQFKDDVRRIKSEYKELKSGGNYQKPPSVSEEPAEESDEKGESLE